MPAWLTAACLSVSCLCSYYLIVLGLVGRWLVGYVVMVVVVLVLGSNTKALQQQQNVIVNKNRVNGGGQPEPAVKGIKREQGKKIPKILFSFCSVCSARCLLCSGSFARRISYSLV